MTLGTDLIRNVLLGLEACIVVLATLHSAHAAVTADRLQSLQCAAAGDCAESDAVSLVSSGLALAILSLVVFLARVVLLQLRHFPRSVGLLYDMLMATLWTFGLAHLVLARETAHNLSNGSAADMDGVVVTCWRLRGVAMASVAAVFYSGRLLLEMVLIFTCAPPDYRPIEQDERDEEKGRVLATVHAPQAYSPVLAFFPDD